MYVLTTLHLSTEQQTKAVFPLRLLPVTATLFSCYNYFFEEQSDWSQTSPVTATFEISQLRMRSINFFVCGYFTKIHVTVSIVHGFFGVVVILVIRSM